MKRISSRLYVSKAELDALANWHQQQASEIEDRVDDPFEGEDPADMQRQINEHRDRAADLADRSANTLAP